ncbi:autotransporter domain-containing protein [Sphingopyxis sp.]|jgi:hypothetical protein|uniref:autotransporter domain-containing protein n=1 Tax=Sphingomonadales TaxID=204457 RepID=UPI003F70EC35
MIEPMLVLSTGNLTFATCNHWLKQSDHAVFEKSEYGWFVYVDEPGDARRPGRLNADGPGFQPYLSAAWNRASGDRGAGALAGFATGGGSFALLGTLIPKNSAEVEAGFDYGAGNLRIGAAYSGTLASDRSTHGLRITARIAF